MKVYMSDEIGYEISEFDVPDRLAMTGPRFDPEMFNVPSSFLQQTLTDVHLVGAVEGYIAGKDGAMEPDEWNIMLDDDEYLANRRIEHTDDGTLVLTARFGRDKKYVMAFNRDNDGLGKAAVEKWISGEVEG